MHKKWANCLFEVADPRSDYVMECDGFCLEQDFGRKTFVDALVAKGETILVNKDGRDIAIRWVRS
jgi:hypothetical protein